MQAIMKLALPQQGTHFGEKVRQLFFLYVYQPQFLDTRRIYQKRIFLPLKHLSKGSGMRTLVGKGRNFACAQYQVGCDNIDQAGLSYARMAWE